MASERVKFLVHQGSQVLLLDLANAAVDDIACVIDTARPVIRRAAPQSMLTLTDVTNITVREVSSSNLIAFLNENKPYVKAAAVTGISGLARSILATMRILTGRQLMDFRTRQDALDWLVSVPSPDGGSGSGSTGP